MADSMNYVYRLTEELSARPANTEEEYYAATEIEKMMKEHGIETALQEFPIPVYSNLALPLLSVLMCLCALFAQLHWILSVVCMLFSLLILLLYLFERFDKGIISRLSHNGASQNVIGRHAGTPAGPNKRPRPVVIIANYDSPKADILKLPFLAPFEPYMHSAIKVSMLAVPACLFIKSLAFMPDIIKPALWVLALIFSLPLLIKGLFGLIQYFALGYVQGANDNLSGFAAMMGVLSRVQPYRSTLLANSAPRLHNVYDEEGGQRHEELSGSIAAPVQESELDESPHSSSEPTSKQDVLEQDAPFVSAVQELSAPSLPAVKFIRRGAGVARAAGVVPQGAKLSYVDQDAVLDLDTSYRTDEDLLKVQPLVADAASMISEQSAGQITPVQAERRLSPAEEQEVRLRLQAQQHSQQKEDVAQAVRSRFADLPVDYKRRPEQEQIQNNVEDQRENIAAQDKGAYLQSEYSVSQEEKERPASEPLRGWGESQFKPQAANLSLLDIPDPSISAVDPYNVTDIHPIGDFNPQDFPADEFETGTFVVSHNPRNSYELVEMPKENALRRFGDKLGAMFSKKDKSSAEEGSLSNWLGVDEDFNAKKDGRKIGSWDNFSEDDSWRGGATRIPRNYDNSESFEYDNEEYIDESHEEEYEEAGFYEDECQEDFDRRELREVVMSLDDSELTSHEIWFVATGGSSYNHEGIKQFLHEYKNELRGAFVIYVRGVGAGQLSVIGKEGAYAQRNGDRRLLNLIRRIGKDFARPVEQADMSWTDTEATPMMRAGYRSISLMGLHKGVVPYSGWSGDTLEQLNAEQIATAVDIIAETIRRS